MSDDLKQYPERDGTVQWDRRLCIHIGECGRSKDELFVAGRDPWCDPDRVPVERLAEVVERCPTGALVRLGVGGEVREQAEARNTVVIANNGPLYLKGRLEIDGAAREMAGVGFRAALCRCGQSKNKPFCDNSHEGAGFVDRGAVGETGGGASGEAGPLAVKRAKNGPLLLSGDFTIVAGSGREAWTGNKAALCRCGQSKNKPFCDGAHSKSGFEAE